MRISTKGRYAIKLMLDLACYGHGVPTKIKDIARRQGISVKYLEQIVSSLNKAGYVKSVRGAQGGYILSKKPEKYTIAMVLKVMEGSLSPIDCVGEDGAYCENRSICVSVRIWERLDEAISGVLNDIRLSDLVEWQEELSDNYVI